jgi:Nucleotide exchange factor Fes1
MKDAIAVLGSPASTTQERQNALEALQYLVEPIDNANGAKAVARFFQGSFSWPD